MIVPTSSPLSAASTCPGLRPLTICSSLHQRARGRYSTTTRSTTTSGRSRSIELLRGDPRDVRRGRVLLRIVGVEAVLVLDEDRARRAEDLGRQEHAGVGAVRRDAAALLALLPVAERRHAGHDRDAAELEVERQLLEVVGQDVDAAVLREQHLQHARVLHRDVLAERREHAGRHLELATRSSRCGARACRRRRAARPGCPSFRAATISSRIGNSAARPRSRMLWPPILTTLTSGITAVGR